MFIILWDVKEPTHLSQRVGHVVPGVVVCLLWCIMVGRVNAWRYYLHQATLKSEAKEIYMIYVDKVFSFASYVEINGACFASRKECVVG